MRDPESKRTFYHSLWDALRGIGFTWAAERNFRIHTMMGVLAIVMGISLHINRREWLALSICILMVIMAEMFNTSIEVLVDLVTRKKKYRAMLSKDIAAGAVLIAAFNAALTGGIIFIPKIWLILTGGGFFLEF